MPTQVPTRVERKRVSPKQHEVYLAAYEVTGEDCFTWSGPSSHGYGNAGWMPAHRYVYLAVVGPIPDGLQLDHLCLNTLCVNPDHLEPVTPRENVRRSNNPAGLNARKTHCIRGHAFDEANTYVYRIGKRACRKCGALKVAARRAQSKAVAA